MHVTVSAITEGLYVAISRFYEQAGVVVPISTDILEEVEIVSSHDQRVSSYVEVIYFFIGQLCHR